MENKKFEFSKLIIFFVFLITIIISAAALAFCFMYQTSEPLIYLIPSIFTELAAGTGFYYWKARSENKIKITLSMIKELSQIENLNEQEVEVLKSLIESLG